MGQGRAVAQLDEAVDDRLRVDDHVDVVIRGAEQVVGLDQLEALVHERGRVDGDLAAHRPGGMGERLLDGDRLQLGGLAAAERSPRRGEDQLEHGAGPLGGQQLVQRRVLGVDRDDRGPGGLGELRYQLAADDQRLLVGQRQVDPLAQRRHRRHQARRAHDPVEHQVTAGLGDERDEPVGPSQHLAVGPGLGGLSGGVGVGQGDPLDPVGAGLLEQGLPRAPGAQAHHLQLVLAAARDDVEGLDPDRAGGPQDDEPARHGADCRRRPPRLSRGERCPAR